MTPCRRIGTQATAEESACQAAAPAIGQTPICSFINQPKVIKRCGVLLVFPAWYKPLDITFVQMYWQCYFMPEYEGDPHANHAYCSGRGSQFGISLAPVNLDRIRSVRIRPLLPDHPVHSAHGQVLTAAQVDLVNTCEKPHAVQPAPIDGAHASAGISLEPPSKSVNLSSTRLPYGNSQS